MKNKEDRKYFYAPSRDMWREWLKNNYLTEEEIWFVFPTTASGEATVTYNDAVEEALCFGWIDSTASKIDDLHGARRFCPRRVGSTYSRPNIERLIWLDKNNMIEPNIRETVLELIYEPYAFPEDILEIIRNDPDVSKNFDKFSEPYKRIRIAYIDDARHRPEEFEKRLKNFLEKTRNGKMIVGYGGIDKYYK